MPNKVSKTLVDYGHGMGNTRCRNCVHWLGNGKCERVMGEISSMAWCKLFRRA